MTPLPPLPLVDGCLFIDNSTLECLNTCPRALQYKFLHKRTISEPNYALSFGSAIHAALAHRFIKCGSDPVTGEVEQEQFNILQKHFDENPVTKPSEYRNLDYATKIITKYNQWRLTMPWEPVFVEGKPMVEVPFAVQFATIRGRPVFYIGKIDQLVFKDRHHFTVDRKTTSRLGENFFHKEAVSPQHEGYCFAVKKTLGIDCAGFIIEAIRTSPPTKKSENGEDVDKKRDSVIKADLPPPQTTYLRQGQLDEWQYNTTKLIEDFLWQYEQGYLPQKKAWCVGIYGKCEYYDVCTLSPDNRLALLESDMYKDYTWSPLNEQTQTQNAKQNTDTTKNQGVRTASGNSVEASRRDREGDVPTPSQIG